MGKKSGQQTQTVVEKQGPYAPAVPGLQMGVDELMRIYGGGAAMPAAPRPEDFYTSQKSFQFGKGGLPMSQVFDTARYNDALRQYQAQLGARQQQQPAMPEYGLGQLGAEELRKVLSGQYLGEGNPYIQNVIDAMTRDVTPQVSGLFEGGSRYGSGAHQQALARELASRSGALRFGAYEAERGRMGQALGMAPQYDMLPFQMASARAALPYENIRQYLGLQLPIANVGSAGQKDISSPIYSNPLLGGLSGGAAGAGLGLALGQAGALGEGVAFGPWGWGLTAAGAALGLLGS